MRRKPHARREPSDPQNLLWRGRRWRGHPGRHHRAATEGKKWGVAGQSTEESLREACITLLLRLSLCHLLCPFLAQRHRAGQEEEQNGGVERGEKVKENGLTEIPDSLWLTPLFAVSYLFSPSRSMWNSGLSFFFNLVPT